MQVGVDLTGVGWGAPRYRFFEFSKKPKELFGVFGWGEILPFPESSSDNNYL